MAADIVHHRLSFEIEVGVISVLFTARTHIIIGLLAFLGTPTGVVAIHEKLPHDGLGWAIDIPLDDLEAIALGQHRTVSRSLSHGMPRTFPPLFAASLAAVQAASMSPTVARTGAASGTPIYESAVAA